MCVFRPAMLLLVFSLFILFSIPVYSFLTSFGVFELFLDFHFKLFIDLKINTPVVFKLVALCIMMGFPNGSDGKESACNTGDLGLIPGLGRSPGEGNGYSVHYYDIHACLFILC